MAQKKTAQGRKESKKDKTPKQDLAAIADYAVLLKPMITEKGARMGTHQSGGAVFKVDRRASKTDIKRAVEQVFKVQVQKVRTVNVLGKIKRTSRSSGRRASYKKAYVTLKPGQTLNIVEGL